MSWLSELFGGGDEAPYYGPGSPVYEENVRNTQRAQEAAAEADRQNKANALYQQQLEALQQQYAPSELDKRLEQMQLEQLDTEAQRNRLRSEALGRVSGIFTPEFERMAIPSTADDPYVAAAFASERGKADEYLSNLLKRGVITQTGFQGGEKAIGEQEAGVRTQLSDIGEQLLEAQRGKFTDIANRARGAASTLDIGQTFDPSIYEQELGSSAEEFGKTFGDVYSSRAPKGLFDLAALSTAAGAAQGAQNLAFDPAAVAGFGTTEEGEPILPPAKKRASTAVF